MKKLCSLAILLGISSLAIAEQPMVTMPQQDSIPPKIVAGAFELNPQTGLKAINQNAVSRSSPQAHFCWIAYDLNVPAQVSVQEEIKSPDVGIFKNDKAVFSRTSRDGKSHLILSTLDNINGHITQCWKFNEQDPIGDYSIDVMIDDHIKFPTQYFKVIQ